MLQHDLARLVGMEHAQVIVFACFGVPTGPPDLELGPLERIAGDAVHLQYLERGLDQVGQLNGGGVVGFQLDDVDGIIVDVIGGGSHLKNFKRSGPEALPKDGPVRRGLALVGKAAVHLLDLKDSTRDGLPGLPVQLQQPDAGAGAVGKGHSDVLALLGVDPDGLAVVGVQNPGGGHIGFLDFKTPAGHIGQGHFAVRPGGHIVLVADVDASDMEAGVWDGVACFGVHLLNGQASLVVVGLGHNDGLLPL